MPRLDPKLIRHAYGSSPLLAALLTPCRDLPSARAELRWLTEHVHNKALSRPSANPITRLHHLVRLRRRGVPLQYLLASQPFGPLDILCRRGVLIPRPETEAYTAHLAALIRSRFPKACSPQTARPPLNILDLCSGSGCIALGLFALLRPEEFSSLRVVGVDVSPAAVALARRNAVHNALALSQTPTRQLSFLQADILAPAFDPAAILPSGESWDIVVANPPYIDPATWAFGRGELGLSVRRFEPELALVAAADAPVGVCVDGQVVAWERKDAFYGRLAQLVRVLKPELVLWEIGDETQAQSVLGIVKRMGLDAWQQEVWRDWPDGWGDDSEETQQSLGTVVRGSGNIRSIFLEKTS